MNSEGSRFLNAIDMFLVTILGRKMSGFSHRSYASEDDLEGKICYEIITYSHISQ